MKRPARKRTPRTPPRLTDAALDQALRVTDGADWRRNYSAEQARGFIRHLRRGFVAALLHDGLGLVRVQSRKGRA